MDTEMLLKKIREAGYENKIFAEKLGMAESTFYRKIKRKNFTIKEAQGIKNLLSLSAEDSYAIFFTNKLA